MTKTPETVELKPLPKSVAFGFAVLLIVGTGSLIGLTSGSGNEWYQGLEKSFLNPPGYLFGIVWPVLYALMAIALVIVAYEKSPLKNKALALFAAQLVLNYGWSYVFFTFQQITLGFIWIVVLAILATMTALTFHKIKPIAGWLFAPYILWLAFAAYLNGAIMILN